jgi:hypothetical protein
MRAFVSFVIIKEIAENIQTFEYGNTIENDFEPSEQGIWEYESAISRMNSGVIKVLNFVKID